jgi:hypothetical protein
MVRAKHALNVESETEALPWSGMFLYRCEGGGSCAKYVGVKGGEGVGGRGR